MCQRNGSTATLTFYVIFKLYNVCKSYCFFLGKKIIKPFNVMFLCRDDRGGLLLFQKSDSWLRSGWQTSGQNEVTSWTESGHGLHILDSVLLPELSLNLSHNPGVTTAFRSVTRRVNWSPWRFPYILFPIYQLRLPIFSHRGQKCQPLPEPGRCIYISISVYHDMGLLSQSCMF